MTPEQKEMRIGEGGVPLCRYDILNALAGIASKDDARPTLRCVTYYDGWLWAVDGFRVTRYRLPQSRQLTESFAKGIIFRVSAKLIKDLRFPPRAMVMFKAVAMAQGTDFARSVTFGSSLGSDGISSSSFTLATLDGLSSGPPTLPDFLEPLSRIYRNDTGSWILGHEKVLSVGWTYDDDRAGKLGWHCVDIKFLAQGAAFLDRLQMYHEIRHCFPVLRGGETAMSLYMIEGDEVRAEVTIMPVFQRERFDGDKEDYRYAHEAIIRDHEMRVIQKQQAIEEAHKGEE